ncbi:hypothetical protein [Deinococcus radiodurans]|nr:hypothetical protein [Deinococcus radiodurans]QIP29709.1 hypothetical protein HAV23_11585 [Deinococcus radiodurans]QIP31610.1 hypothetical protein HAV35_05210 [Deinococcus radiodurans]UID70715.1 hypothetical protein DRO_1720 [Deinococcus radiodurans R1 = ATCC 13939 = DSM 20539]UTA51133.1 hypothetical protein MSS93_02070 [Deinococcus radiodurans]
MQNTRRGVKERAAVLAACLLGGAVLAQSVGAQGVGMSSNWFDIKETRSQCLQRATAAVKAAGFTANFEVVGGSGIFADNEEYSVNFRCVTEKKMALVFVAGPDSDLADEYVGEISLGYAGK